MGTYVWECKWNLKTVKKEVYTELTSRLTITRIRDKFEDHGIVCDVHKVIQVGFKQIQVMSHQRQS